LQPAKEEIVLGKFSQNKPCQVGLRCDTYPLHQPLKKMACSRQAAQTFWPSHSKAAQHGAAFFPSLELCQFRLLVGRQETGGFKAVRKKKTTQN
jgi:hypothetical protein